MKTLLFYTFLLMGLTGAGLTAQAQFIGDDVIRVPASEGCPPGVGAQYYVFFGNGIRNDVTDRDASARKLEEFLDGEYKGTPINVRQAINPTEGLLDFVEVYDQKMAENPDLEWRNFFKTFVDGVGSGIRDFFNVQDLIGPIMDTKSRLQSSERFVDDTVRDHADAYENLLRAGQRVVVVSHSQGNLYANAVYDLLESRNASNYTLSNFGLAGVATPANGVSTGDGYVTSDNDRVIDALRLSAPVLPSNDNSVPDFRPETSVIDQLLGHSFKNIYLNPTYPIHDHVRRTIRETLDRVAPRPGSPSEDAIITGELYWDTSSLSGLQMTILTPSYRPQIPEPFTGPGTLYQSGLFVSPQYYEIRCSEFEIGHYLFGVNYLEGTGPVDVDFRMTVFGETFSLSTGLIRSEGDPIRGALFFDVYIKENPDGSYSFEVL